MKNCSKQSNKIERTAFGALNIEKLEKYELGFVRGGGDPAPPIIIYK